VGHNFTFYFSYKSYICDHDYEKLNNRSLVVALASISGL